MLKLITFYAFFFFFNTFIDFSVADGDPLKGDSSRGTVKQDFFFFNEVSVTVFQYIVSRWVYYKNLVQQFCLKKYFCSFEEQL